jgi:hypothetical protein
MRNRCAPRGEPQKGDQKADEYPLWPLEKEEERATVIETA